MQILVRAPNWIGDQILAYPFFYYLRKAYPKAKIVSACVDWVEAVQFRGLVDDVIVLPKVLRKGFWAKFETLEESSKLLRDQGPWDLGISLPNSFSSAWMLYRAGAKKRRGYRSDGRRFLLNEGVPISEFSNHRAQNYVDLLKPEITPDRDVKRFWGVPPENDLDPGVPGVLPLFNAEKEWPKVKPAEPPSQPYWLLAPGSAAEARRWDVAKFSELAQIVYSATGLVGAVVGGPTEAPLAERLKSVSGAKLLDWTALGPVSIYWKIFRNARFTVSNDSGLAHVASLCGSPVQVVWGAGDPKRTEPIGPGKARIAFNPVDCWPCERNSCYQPSEKRLECLRGIYPDAIWQEIQRGIQASQHRPLG